MRRIATVIRDVTTLDIGARVTFKALSKAIQPRLGRVDSPALYRDIRAAAEMLGLHCGKIYGFKTVVRGIKLNDDKAKC